MSYNKLKNNAKSTVADSPLAAGATTLNVATGGGASFPDTFPFLLTLWDAATYTDPGNDPDMEIVECSGRTGDVLTISRGKEDTLDVAHANSQRVALLITAGLMSDYFLASGERAMTGDLDMGSTNDIINLRNFILDPASTVLHIKDSTGLQNVAHFSYSGGVAQTVLYGNLSMTAKKINSLDDGMAADDAATVGQTETYSDEHIITKEFVPPGSWEDGYAPVFRTSDGKFHMEEIELAFTGAAYVNQHTMADDLAYRFETAEKKLSDCIVSVTNYAAVFGDSTGQTFTVAVDGTASLGKLDLSTLYIKNAAAGNNATIDILGTEA